MSREERPNDNQTGLNRNARRSKRADASRTERHRAESSGGTEQHSERYERQGDNISSALRVRASIANASDCARFKETTYCEGERAIRIRKAQPNTRPSKRDTTITCLKSTRGGCKREERRQASEDNFVFDRISEANLKYQT